MRTARKTILWRQVWGLAALLAAILFSFMIYGFYQPRILQQLGFGWLAINLGILQGFLGAAVEPLVGIVSDRVLQRVGSRLPMIATGITLAGLLFVAVALLTQQTLPQGLRWIVPLVMTLWVMAMLVFRGPAIALLRQFAPTQELPYANAILTLVLCLVGALGPLIGIVLESVGAFLAFLLGAGTLIAATLLLYSSKPQAHLFSVQEKRAISPAMLGGLFLVGIIAGMVFFLALQTIPKALSDRLPGFTPEQITAAILLIGALATVPVERWIPKLGVDRAMASSLVTMLAIAGLALLSPISFLTMLCILLLGIVFSVVLVSQIPFALSKVPPSQAGLSTGLYFGGIGAGTSLITVFLQGM
jgi:MFS family permease